MNRFFHFIIYGISALLILFFLVLILTMLAELFQESAVRAPDYGEVAFAIKLSLYTATISSLIALAVSIPVAYLFSRYSFPGKSLLDTVLDLPIVLSPIALGALLLIFFNTAPGRQIEDILGPIVFEVRGIIFAQFFVIVGLSIRLLKETFEGVDVEYENMSRTLGLNRMMTFLKVTFPMAKKGIIAAFLLVWGRAIGEFGATVTLAGATTMKTETLPVAIFLNFETVNISSAIMFILVLITLSLAILFFVRRVNFHVG